MDRVHVATTERECMIDISDDVRSAVQRAGVRDGVAVVFVPHTTAAVTVNENADADVPVDMVAQLRKLVPQDPAFRHAEGNSDAHIKATLVGPSVALVVADGEPRLGRWQGVFLCEFDGPRTREVWIEVGATKRG